ncbi:MAG TPA: ABC transporter ATP-binding protein [Methylibium sp.]|uniref:ABC transporter ATP-binding protein n=1 Tax=Methylibium sp. TaxID=2067992 RepID=UPI002DC02B7E|nr:ABC transporter ATP-binding protein [Methylibium sp.]HEU4457510.1 ABC transporter ATP-binding protein [Methylibium sp.]
MAAVPLLDVRGLHTQYGASRVLHGVSLSIGAGEAVGLLGRNGMGKTTLIRSALGLVRPSAGTVAVRGRDCTTDARNLRAERIARLGLGYVPEGRQIFPNLSVRENLLVAARAGPDGRSDWDHDRVIATFPRLAERLGHGGQQLSGGEQQMLAIGRALMTNPELLILDEATEGLAPLIVAEIWRTLTAIRATGMACLVVDRNLRAVLAHTDRCLVLEKGRVVLEGGSAQLAADEAALHRHLGV